MKHRKPRTRRKVKRRNRTFKKRRRRKTRTRRRSMRGGGRGGARTYMQREGPLTRIKREGKEMEDRAAARREKAAERGAAKIRSEQGSKMLQDQALRQSGMNPVDTTAPMMMTVQANTERERERAERAERADIMLRGEQATRNGQRPGQLHEYGLRNHLLQSHLPRLVRRVDRSRESAINAGLEPSEENALRMKQRWGDIDKGAIRIHAPTLTKEELRELALEEIYKAGLTG